MTLTNIPNVPMKEVQLPSRGIFYGDKLPNGLCRIRKWTVDELSVLESQGANASEKTRATVDQCVILPAGLEPGHLLASDRFALLLYQRTYSLSTTTYKYDFKCEHCGKVNRGVLCNMETDFDEKLPQEGAAEPFSVRLPDANAEVTFRLLRGYDEAPIMQAANAEARGGMATGAQAAGVKGDPTRAHRMARQITSVNGNEWAMPDKLAFVRKLTAGDAARFNIAQDAAEPGIKTTLYPTCKHCGGENETGLPMDLEFFRPTVV
jgi:hypothetical protein